MLRIKWCLLPPTWATITHLYFNQVVSKSTNWNIYQNIIDFLDKDYFLNSEGHLVSCLNQTSKNQVKKTMPWKIQLPAFPWKLEYKGTVCLERSVYFILFFFKLSRKTLWDVTFCFHKHTQGVRQSPILYSLKIECVAVFAGLFNMSLSTNFMYNCVTVPWKYSEKEETVSKEVLSIITLKVFQWKTFPTSLQSCRGTRNQMGESIFTN